MKGGGAQGTGSSSVHAGQGALGTWGGAGAGAWASVLLPSCHSGALGLQHGLPLPWDL